MNEENEENGEWIMPTGAQGLIGHHGRAWKEVPAISIGKNYITVNSCAERVFGFRDHDLVLIGVRRNGVLHLKVAEDSHEQEMAFELRAKRNGTKGTSFRLTFGNLALCKMLLSKGVKYGDYEIVMTPGQRLWVSDLTAPMRLGLLGPSGRQKMTRRVESTEDR